MDQEIRKIIREQVNIFYESDKIKFQIDEQYEMLNEFLGLGKKKQQPVSAEEFKNRVEKMIHLIANLKNYYKKLTGASYDDMEAQKDVFRALNGSHDLSGTPFEDPNIKNDVIKIIKDLPKLMKQYAEMDSILQFKYNIDLRDTHRPPVPEPVTI